MIKNGVYVLQKDATVTKDLKFSKNQEIEVVDGVLYMGGYPLPPNLQALIMTWMKANLGLFLTDNRNF